ncbi:MAG: STAS domain-containing protein [Methylobacter sp.]|nr:MAG: STAS domain-containing protein [Methylobacter sp.]
MATSEENDLIGYDPLAWMEGDTDKNEEAINNEVCDSNNKPEEQQLIDNEIREADDYSDDSIGNTEESTILNVTKESELAIDDVAVENDSALAEEIVGALSDTGVVAEDSVSEQTDGLIIDLDATLSIQNVVKLHEKLKNFIAINEQIEINASDVSSIDTTTLQLLVALKRDAVKLQKKVSIIYPSPRFVESAKLLGLLDVLDVHDV